MNVRAYCTHFFVPVLLAAFAFLGIVPATAFSGFSVQAFSALGRTHSVRFS